MKLSNDTLNLLVNFSKINQNLKLNEGNMLRTMNVEKTVYATTHISEEFNQQFGIYDLSEFLNTISMFNDPELDFKGDMLTISDGTNKNIQTKYYSANMAILTEVPDMKELPVSENTFTLTSKNFKMLEKGGNTLKLKDLKFKSENGVLVASVYDESEANKNTVSIELTKEYGGEDFEVHLRLSKMIVLEGDYECSIIANRILRLKNVNRDLVYIISLDVNE